MCQFILTTELGCPQVTCSSALVWCCLVHASLCLWWLYFFTTAAWCPEPPSVAFADHDGPKQTHFLPGSEVRYTCRLGFASDGIAMARCMTSGKWAGPMMACRGEFYRARLL